MAARRPPFLTRLRVRGYRSLNDVELRLGALSVLVGPNGAGKSTLLDVLAFLGDAARLDLAPALALRGGFERVRFRGQHPARTVEVVVEALVTTNSSWSAPDEYTLRFSMSSLRRGGRPTLRREESLIFKRTQGQGRRITLNGTELVVVGSDQVRLREEVLSEGTLALTTLPKLGRGEGGQQLETLARLFESFRVFDVDVEAVRRPSSTSGDAARLTDRAENLGVYLQQLQRHHPEVFVRLERDATHFVPGLEGISFRATSGAVEGLVTQLHERGLEGPTDLGEASFGSIRALALLALLHDPEPAKITCIEEIDHGLHPYVLDRLVDLLREASERTQLLIATHSPALVNRLTADELIVCERAADGSARIPAIAPEEVRAMEDELEGELSLGELWFTGALGGVPES